MCHEKEKKKRFFHDRIIIEEERFVVYFIVLVEVSILGTYVDVALKTVETTHYVFACSLA